MASLERRTKRRGLGRTKASSWASRASRVLPDGASVRGERVGREEGGLPRVERSPFPRRRLSAPLVPRSIFTPSAT